MKSKALFVCFLSVFATFVHAQISIDTLISRANQLRSEKKYVEAEQVLNEALQYEEASKDMLIRGKIYTIQYYCLKKEGKLEDALEASRMALEAYKLTDDQILKGDAYYNMGIIQKSLADFDQSALSLRKALLIFEPLDDHLGLANVNEAIGNLYNDLNHHNKALVFLEKALYYNLERGDSLGLARNYHNLGQVYNNVGEYSLAREHLFYAKKLNEILDRSTYLNTAQIGISYLREEVYDSSEFYLQASLLEAEEKNNAARMTVAHKHLGNLYFEMHDYQKSKNHLEIALDFSNQTGQRLETLEILTTLFKLEQVLHPESKIYARVNTIITLKDSILGGNDQLSVARLEVEREIIEQQLNSISQTNEITLEKAKNETLELKNLAFLIGIIIISIFIIIIAFFLVKLRKSKAETEQKNQELKESKDEIENLHKELSHRTKNYYQMFGGILKYDRKKVENAETQRLLDNYIRRVEAMSQIQRYLLEKTTEGHDVQLDLYLSEILSNIDLILNQITPKVHIEERFETISCDYDKALRLGLVMNEMVSNSFEHGFHQIENPELTITLICNEDDIIRMTIADNGIGMDKTRLKPSHSKGIGLMEMILKSIEGELEYLNTESSGTTVCIRVAK